MAGTPPRIPTDAIPRDQFRRPMHDLRISVTDRCNLRCTYCMPEERFDASHTFLERREILTFEEIALIARAAAGLGVMKLRITGGEPLLRRDLPALIAQLAEIPGIQDIALTTNGLLLPRFAKALRDAGLGRVTVSLDSMNETTLSRISGRAISPAMVLDGIEAARDAGFERIKVNTVVQRDVNDRDVIPLAEQFRGAGVVLRFIEFMDVGTLNGWNWDAVVPASEMRDAIAARYPLEPLDPNYRGEVADRYRYVDGAGEIGFITSVSQPFCRDCTRLRLSPDGALFTCLFASRGHALKPLLRAGASEAEIAAYLHGIWHVRDDRYSELRSGGGAIEDKVEMYHIGG